MTGHFLIPLLLVCAAIAAGCSTTDNCLITKAQSVAWNVDPAIPGVIRPPQGHVLLGHVVGHGVQTYVLEADPKAPGVNRWVATNQESGDLLDEDGHVIGHHEDNAWAIQDGSQLAAEPVAQVPLQNRAPWVLLQVTSHEGRGLLGSAEFVQQLHTVGGPPVALNNAPVGTRVRAEYSADYYFYGSLAPQTRVNRGGNYTDGS